MIDRSIDKWFVVTVKYEGKWDEKKIFFPKILMEICSGIHQSINQSITNSLKLKFFIYLAHTYTHTNKTNNLFSGFFFGSGGVYGFSIKNGYY